MIYINDNHDIYQLKQSHPAVALFISSNREFKKKNLYEPFLLFFV